MNINLAIEQLRMYCPAFGRRVAGAAEYGLLKENTTLATPSAFVIPLADDPEPMANNSPRMRLTETFAVIVVMDNAADERGQNAAQSYEGIRAALWQSLIGWQPQAHGYYLTQYAGSHLLALNRSRAWYQFEFEARREISPDECWQGHPMNQYPALETVHLDVDMIDPAALPHPGPDGRIELTADFALTQE